MSDERARYGEPDVGARNPVRGLPRFKWLTGCLIGKRAINFWVRGFVMGMLAASGVLMLGVLLLVGVFG